MNVYKVVIYSLHTGRSREMAAMAADAGAAERAAQREMGPSWIILYVEQG